MLKKLKKKIRNLKRLNSLEKEYKNISEALVDFNLDVRNFIDGNDYLSQMDEQDRTEFLRHASALYNNPSFKRVVDELINIQASHSILQAPDSRMIMFDRAGINVLSLLKDEFKKLDGRYKDIIKPEEEFDKYEAT